MNGDGIVDGLVRWSYRPGYVKSRVTISVTTKSVTTSQGPPPRSPVDRPRQQMPPSYPNTLHPHLIPHTSYLKTIQIIRGSLKAFRLPFPSCAFAVDRSHDSTSRKTINAVAPTPTITAAASAPSHDKLQDSPVTRKRKPSATRTESDKERF